MIAMAIIIAYVAVGLMLSFYGVSFIVVNYKKQYKPKLEISEWILIVYFALTVTSIWPGFAIMISIIHIFEKSLVNDLNEDFSVVLDHHFGEMVPLSKFA